MSPYEEALDYLHQFTDYEQAPQSAYAASNFDLRRMQALLSLLDNPDVGRVTVHIAGTKGKGSVAAMTAAVLQAGSYRVGLLTSPHLCTFRERIRIDGQPISEDDFVAAVDELRPAVDTYHRDTAWGRLTTFELSTTAAFLAFRRAGATAQVLEVGMGGRLDATNVVTPHLTIITPISYDHMAILGNTIEAIAGEKAGIIKPGVPLVIAPQPEEARRVFAKRCYELNAPLFDVTLKAHWARLALDPDLRGQWCTVRLTRTAYQIWIPLLGAVQMENAVTVALAIETLRDSGIEIPYKSLEVGLSAVRWPGRLQVVERDPLLVLDGAHNDASARRLHDALTKDFEHRNLILIVGISSDKDIPAIAAALAPGADYVIATRAASPRAAKPEAIAKTFSEHSVNVESAPDLATALARARTIAGKKDMICVTGSLIVVGETLQLLGLEEQALASYSPTDPPSFGLTPQTSDATV